MLRLARRRRGHFRWPIRDPVNVYELGLICDVIVTRRARRRPHDPDRAGAPAAQFPATPVRALPECPASLTRS